MPHAFILGAILALAAVEPKAQDAWRRQYSVGQQVSFTISGRAADAQPCVVAENDEGSVMRVRCKAFESWRSGTYIVYAAENIRPAGAGGIGRPAPRAAQPAPRTAPTPPRTGAAAAGTLKTGEYACYGSGGRIMIGLGFNVTGPGRYTDLEGGNPGRFTVTNG